MKKLAAGLLGLGLFAGCSSIEVDSTALRVTVQEATPTPVVDIPERLPSVVADPLLGEVVRVSTLSGAECFVGVGHDLDSVGPGAYVVNHTQWHGTHMTCEAGDTIGADQLPDDFVTRIHEQRTNQQTLVDYVRSSIDISSGDYVYLDPQYEASVVRVGHVFVDELESVELEIFDTHSSLVARSSDLVYGQWCRLTGAKHYENREWQLDSRLVRVVGSISVDDIDLRIGVVENGDTYPGLCDAGDVVLFSVV